MMHELSQGAGFIRWFEDYGYGYYHADTTPLYIVAVRDYVRASGDAASRRTSGRRFARRMTTAPPPTRTATA